MLLNGFHCVLFVTLTINCIIGISNALEAENVTQINLTTDEVFNVTTDDTPEEDNTTKPFKDVYLKANVKLPTEEHKSLSKWFKVRELIFLSGGIGGCIILLVAFSVGKILVRNYNSRKERDTESRTRQLLREQEGSSEMLISSDEEEFSRDNTR